MVIIGAGRVGTSLRLRARARGLDAAVIDRASGWEAVDGPAGGPILVTVRNADLAAVVARVPARRRQDLVLVQNGAIRELAADLGLPDATRGVLYLWAARRDEDVIAARWSPFTGPHAEAVARWFTAIDLPAEAVHPLRFVVYEVEKLLWLVVFGWLCKAHDATTGEVADRFPDEIDALTRELLPITRAAWGIDLEPAWVVERLLQWTHAIPSFAASTAEDPWRGGWLWARARRYGLDTPLFDHLRAGG